MIVDLFLVYQFIRRLATPFNEWEAYKLGIIDENGNVLKKRRELRDERERKAFGIFDVMILNLKKLLAKVPGGSTRLASYAAALYLIREWNHFSDSTMLTEDVSDEEILQSLLVFQNGYSDYILEMNDVNQKSELDALFEQRIFETPTVNVGSGNIAGMGVGPQGEPGLTPAQMRRYKSRNKPGKKLRDILNMGEDLSPATTSAIPVRRRDRGRKYNKHMQPGTVSAAASSERII